MGTAFVIIVVGFIAEVFVFILFKKIDPSQEGNERKEANLLIDEDALDDNLSSASNIDYRKLRALLYRKQFHEANQETSKLLTVLTGHSYPMSRSSFNFMYRLDLDVDVFSEKISNIPCTDIHTIEQLWNKYSDGRFGFGIQCQIWENIFTDKLLETQEFNERERIHKTDREVNLEAQIKAFPPSCRVFDWSDSNYDSDLGSSISLPLGYYPRVFPSNLGSYSLMLSLFKRLKECY